jgi:hypothetical protein
LESLKDAAFQRFHPVGVAGAFVIVAEEMQHAMHDQMPDVMGERFALRRRLARNRLEGQHDVAEEARFAGGEGQDVGRRVLAAPPLIQRPHPGVVAQYHAHFRGIAFRVGGGERGARGRAGEPREAGQFPAPGGAGHRHIDDAA